MKKLFYFIIILIFGACSVSTEDSSTTTSSGTSDGTASAPVELTVGTAKTGGVAYFGDSYYKFTTSSTGAGSYKLAIDSMVITQGSSTYAVTTYLFSNSGLTTSSRLDSESCAASCTLYFDYENLDSSKTYYLHLSAWGTITYSLTVSQGGSEGSKNNPVELTLSTAHTGGKVEGYLYAFELRGNSFYKFTTTSADNYTLSMNNSDDLDCFLFTNSVYWVLSGASSYVSDTHNGCTVGNNLSTTFKGSSGTGLNADTTYYLMIEQRGTTVKTTTYDNMTVAAEG
jgi:hypothetical protein